MEEFTNDKGEVIVIAEMDKCRLIHSIAKYAKNCAHVGGQEQWGEVVKALKGEAMKRLSEKEDEA